MTGPLDGLDQPRPLSDALRARLEDVLLGTADARPLSEEQETSLAAALRDPVGELLADLDAPRPLPVSLRSALEKGLVRRRRAWFVPAAASVAAVAIGVLVLQGGSPPRHQLGLAPRPSTSPSSADVAVPGSGGVAGGTSGGTSTGGGGLPSSPMPLPVSGADGVPAPAVGSGQVPTGTTGGGTAGTSSSGQALPPPPKPPTVSSISPSAGSPGTWVTLTGQALTPTVSVFFGGARAVRVQQVSATQVRALAPEHAAGPVQVVLTTEGGRAAGKRFLYLP